MANIDLDSSVVGFVEALTCIPGTLFVEMLILLREESATTM